MSDNAILERLDQLESRVALERLVYTYAQAFDGHDRELLAEIWHDGAKLSLGDIGQYEGVEAILAGADELWSKTPHMHHWMSNPLIDISGDTATAATALDCFVTDSESGPTQVGGLYRDRFERRNGKWGIVDRSFELHYWTPIANWVPLDGSEALQSTSA
jgi:hypothetical protein